MLWGLLIYLCTNVEKLSKKKKKNRRKKETGKARADIVLGLQPEQVNGGV